MAKFQVWLNDAGYEPYHQQISAVGGMPVRKDATVVDVEADECYLTPAGDLIFQNPPPAATMGELSDRTVPVRVVTGPHPIIAGFARGTFTHWKRIE